MGLDLDARQRAMLEEMHVRVWVPQEAVVAAPSAPVRSRAAAPTTPPVARTSEGVAAAQVRQAAAPHRAVLLEAAAPVIPGVSAPAGAVERMDWRELGRTVAGCSACLLCTGRKAAVFVAEPAPRQADWLVVGEPPDELEERAGVAFSGQVGQLLDNMLRAAQLTRDGSGAAGARLTNVVKCRTVPVRNPNADELATCAIYLQREITLVRPKVILAMGRFAALSLLAERSPELASLPFGKLRGRVFVHAGVPVVVTYHPSRLLRAQQDKALAWADLCLAQDVARNGPPPASDR